MPGAGYLWIWPLLFNTIAWLVVLHGSAKPAGTALVAAALATVILLAPVAHKVFTAFAIGSGALLSALAALFLGLCVFHLDKVRRPWVLSTAVCSVQFGKYA